jgi:sporulation protein YlmC with PRC-barrel domain
VAGARYDLSLSLLDRQILDKDGYAAGKVDDVELESTEGSAPYVVALLSGPGALSPRIGGRLGRRIASVRKRLRRADDPARVSFGVVTRIDDAVHVNVSRHDLPDGHSDEWAREHFIDKIPGAGHEAE